MFCSFFPLSSCTSSPLSLPPAHLSMTSSPSPTLTPRGQAFKATKWRTASGFDTTKRNVVDISRPASQAADSEEFGESLVNRANLTFDRNPLPWKERQLDMNTSSSADILGPRHVPSMDTTVRVLLLVCRCISENWCGECRLGLLWASFSHLCCRVVRLSLRF